VSKDKRRKRDHKKDTSSP